MTNGPSTCLVDTNVFVYAFDSAEVEKQERALTVLTALTFTGLGALTTQILGEFFNATTSRRRRLLSEQEAEDAVVQYARAWPVLQITPWTVIEAVRGSRQHRLSYYDALVWATAKLNGVPNILTEDLQAGQLIEGVRIVNPFASSFDFAVLG